jgi:hypothetical protein
MSSPVTVDIFAEDHAHEALLVPLVQRVARDEGVSSRPTVRSACGGHARAVAELKLYQDLVLGRALGLAVPDVLVVGIDGNCATFARKRAEIQGVMKSPLADHVVIACPDPHVERWYVADPDSFQAVVGQKPVVRKKKCSRGYYKDVLARTVHDAGHPPTLGGIEFAADLVAAMDLYRAGKHDRSFKAFVDDLRRALRTLVRA